MVDTLCFTTKHFRDFKNPHFFYILLCSFKPTEMTVEEKTDYPGNDLRCIFVSNDECVEACKKEKACKGKPSFFLYSHYFMQRCCYFVDRFCNIWVCNICNISDFISYLLFRRSHVQGVGQRPMLFKESLA